VVIEVPHEWDDGEVLCDHEEVFSVYTELEAEVHRVSGWLDVGRCFNVIRNWIDSLRRAVYQDFQNLGHLYDNCAQDDKVTNKFRDRELYAGLVSEELIYSIVSAKFLEALLIEDAIN
jgi:hypothetical protein